MNYRIPPPLAIVIKGLVASSFFAFFKGFLLDLVAMCFLRIRMPRLGLSVLYANRPPLSTGVCEEPYPIASLRSRLCRSSRRVLQFWVRVEYLNTALFFSTPAAAGAKLRLQKTDEMNIRDARRVF
jgi:hypothetical protein